jgi:DNA-binding transcriptional regulator YiaG
MRQWSGDEYDDPIADLRHTREITSRDVADLLGITQATVRQWVARGYITPTGRIGPSNVFRTSDVLEAYDQIARRRKATRKPPEKRGWFADPTPMDRIRTKHYDAVISIDEAARLISVSPATIRSWLHRRHLEALPSSKPRGVRLRLGDVIHAAQARRMPARRRRLGR